MNLLMLRDEAIRLGSQQEQSHGRIISGLAVAATHDRRHADAQAVGEDAEPLHSLRCSGLPPFLGARPTPPRSRICAATSCTWWISGTSPISLNAAITGLKFFFEVTLGQGELMAKMQPVRVPRTLPVVLSREEVGAPDRGGAQPEGTRRRCRWPTAPACAPARWWR